LDGIIHVGRDPLSRVRERVGVQENLSRRADTPMDAQRRVPTTMQTK
jgi:hypothetical protein